MSESNFIREDFLLEGDLAQSLFHDTARNLPIIDYHNHIDPLAIAQNKAFENISALWINGDPYKHRAMRINGIPESGITGDTPDQKKFENWAKTLPKTLGNPLFHWSCLELKRVFGIDEFLTPTSAKHIWDGTNQQLAGEDFSTNEILEKWNIETLCTSDQWLDDFAIHQKASEVSNIRVLPSLRADALLAVDQENYIEFIHRFAAKTDQPIDSLEDLEAAVKIRLAYFNKHQCKLSDHALDAGFYFDLPDQARAADLFHKAIHREALTKEESIQLQSYLLAFLGKEYGKLGWIMQLHIGAQRYTSSRLRSLAGSAGGFATIGRNCDIDSLCRFLDHLEKSGHLPDVILFTLNPADNHAFAALTGSFAEEGKPGKIQFGPAWWYNDHLTGITDQLLAITNYGLRNLGFQVFGS